MSEQGAFDPKPFVASLTQRPGVYQMFGVDNELLYVGKARNLKKRVSSYFSGRAKDAKTMALVRHIQRVEVHVTRTEVEALLLEHTLIKEHRPRFNVLLRDDKSYPWIYLNDKHEYPRLAFYRGPRRKHGELFGPYPSAGAVRETLSELQKLFLIRPCRDSFFANRTRPCLQYQIHRCSAPCVGYIEPAAYREDLTNATEFLRGNSSQVIENLAERMDTAAAEQRYEDAARYRDQVARLRRIETQQVVDGAGSRSLDVIATAQRGSVRAIAVLSIREGRLVGTRNVYPIAPAETPDEELMAAFLSQYFLENEIPPEIVISLPVDDQDLLQAALEERRGSRVQLHSNVRAERQRWLEMARTNAEEAAGLRAVAASGIAEQREDLATELALDAPPERIECFDISHTAGEASVASCVVFGADGPLKASYRRFNIDGIEPGDDYAAMEQALTRRYKRVKKGESPVPDLVLIDGGKGQLGVALEAMKALDFADVPLIGVAKGRARKAGAERLFFPGQDGPLQLPPDSPALRLIQNIRDEAHRFAITAHRQRRSRARQRSPLEEIPGLGPKRRRELLRQFGGLQGVERAGIDDLARTNGISRQMAQKIYDRFHAGSDV
ncbi:MAG: excinuclease ABC subunit UvrC [Pseudomonadota bacterium]